MIASIPIVLGVVATVVFAWPPPSPPVQPQAAPPVVSTETALVPSEPAEPPISSQDASDIFHHGERYFDAGEFGSARKSWEKAANGGNADAMFMLGSIYEHQIGVEQDDEKARKWYEKAVANDNVSAMNSLGPFYENGRGSVAQDYGKALGLYQRAADKGFLTPCTLLAGFTKMVGA